MKMNIKYNFDGIKSKLLIKSKLAADKNWRHCEKFEEPVLIIRQKMLEA